MIRLDRIPEHIVVGGAARPALDKLTQAAKGIEKIFLKDLLGAMRRAMPKGADDSFTTQMYRDMLDDAIADVSAKRGDFGIANQIESVMRPHVARDAFERIRRQIQTGELDLPELFLDLKR